MIVRGRKVFNLVSANIVVMMICNSVFSAMSPYLWLGDVFSKSSMLVTFFTVATTLFYAANTFFACLLFYVNYKFNVIGVTATETKNRLTSEESYAEEQNKPFSSFLTTNSPIDKSPGTYQRVS